MDLEGDLGAVVRARRQDCSYAKTDGLEFDSCNLLNVGAVVEAPRKELPISISISNAVTIYPSPFYDANISRSQSLSPSIFERFDNYYHHVTQKAAWSYATADSSLSAEGKAEKQDQAHDLIMPTTSNGEEQTSGRFGFEVFCPRQTLSSSPPKGTVHVKTPPRSPIRHDDPPAKTPKREPDCRLSSPIRTDSTAEKIDSNKATIPATKRRKPQTKKTVLIPETEGSWNKPGGGGVASDIWAWRKYGQKPIKGSPYPRSYYRCSSCKGCPARKQVERSYRDPTMLEITYTAEHNHAWPTSNHRNGTAFTGSSTSTQKDMIVPQSPQKSDVPAVQGSNPASPTRDIMVEEEKPGSQPATDCLDFNVIVAAVEDHDQTADLHMLRSNHMHYDDLFADLGELKDFARYSADYKSDEETGSTIVDPYNLFNWSSSSSIKTPADS